jgi:hypothetical protein
LVNDAGWARWITGSDARIVGRHVKGGARAGSIVLLPLRSPGTAVSAASIDHPDPHRMSSHSKSQSCLGFLIVVEQADLGLLGGYLLLNAAGRPLEFHCTAPVKPNRAQEILYGPTLRPFLYGEQIGQTLLAKSKLTPLLVCTDSEAMLAVRDHTHIPVALVNNDEAAGATAGSSSSAAFRLGQNDLVLPAPYAADEQTIRQHWPAQADHLDLAEPFTRIREALDEAQKTARAAA